MSTTKVELGHSTKSYYDRWESRFTSTSTQV